MQLRSSPFLGCYAVAAQPYARGDRVLTETAACVWPTDAAADPATLALFGDLCASPFVAVLLPFLACDAQTQAAVWGLHCPDVDEGAETAPRIVTATRSLARQIASVVEFRERAAAAWQTDTAEALAEKVQRLFLIAHLNSHAMGPTHTAIFPAAARVSHSCQPNLLFRGAGRTLTYTALTDIPVGRVLSFSYLSEAELVQATALRRAALQSSKLFHCTCPRCVGPDRAAPMPCPACGSNFCVRRDTSPRVFQLQDLDASASASASPTASAEPWVCEDCDATFPDEAFSEGLQRLEALAPRVQRCARALEEADDAAAAELYEELAEAFEEAEGVSRVHWVTVMAARLLFHLTANCGGCDEGDAGADAEEGAGADALCGSGLAQGGDAARPCDAPPAPNGALDADAPPRARDSETGTSLCADRSAPPDSDQDPLEGVPGADDTASGPGDGVGEDHAHYRALVDAFMEYALPDCPFVVSQWHMFAITLYLQLGLEAEAMPRIVSHGPELEALWGAADPDVAQMMRLLQ